jgi:hypothetical protein
MMNIVLAMTMYAALLPAAKPTDYSTDMVMLTDGQVGQTLKLYVSGQKSRVEGMTAGPLGSVIAIHRRDKGLDWALYPQTMEYTERPVSASQSSGKPDLSSLDLGALKKENLGKETVLGYACTKMRVTFGNLPNGQPLTGTIWVADSLELPIRLDFMGIVQENRNFKAGPQPAALFEIPTGYKKTQSPGAGTSRGAGMPTGSEVTPGAGLKGAALQAIQSLKRDASTVAQKNLPHGNKDGQSSAGATAANSTDGSTGATITLEADTLAVLKHTSGDVTIAKLAEDGSANEGEFTGDRSLQWHDAAEPGALLELALPVQTKGRYAISVRAAKYRTYAIHQFLINGTPLGKPVDMFGNPGQDIVTAFSVDLGEANLNSGSNRLGIRLVGTNPQTIMANHGAGLDWIKLTPVGTKQ